MGTLLVDLPNDILSKLISYLDSHHVMNLYGTGNFNLHAKLRSSHVVTKLNITGNRFQPLPFNGIGIWSNRFPCIKHLILDYYRAVKDVDTIKFDFRPLQHMNLETLKMFTDFKARDIKPTPIEIKWFP